MKKLFFLALLLLNFGSAHADGYDMRPVSSLLNITGSTVVKATNGCLVSVNVTTAGAQGAIYDITTAGAAAAANEIAIIPAVVGTYYYQCFPFFAGLVIVPGSAQVVSISYK
jgi:hypothetical protein